jgi:hypothetical protein
VAEPGVALGQQDLERVGDYVRGHLSTWLSEVAPLVVSVPQLLERTARIEEELKSQRDLMRTQFEASDRRFEELTKHSDQRFEDMGTLFQDLTKHADKRFEDMGIRFQDLAKHADNRFADMGARFEDLTKYVATRFNVLQWSLGGVVVLLTTLMSIYQFVA